MSRDQFRVSIAMCTYNSAAFVEAQLESVLEQTRPADEIVVCDDGSTDGTVEIIERVAQKHRGLRLIRNRERLSFVRNFEKAVGQTMGSIIFLSDSDDVWFPDKVATILEAFVADPEIVMVYSDAVLTNAQLVPVGGTVLDRRKAVGIRGTPTLRQLART